MAARSRLLAVSCLVLALASAPASAVKRRAFATSISGTGNLSIWPGAGGATGLAAGDNICRARATAAGLPNAGTYRAWLSTSTTDAWCHVQGLTGTKATGCGGGSQPGGGPWYLANGITPWSGALDELARSTNPQIYRSVVMDEFGTQTTNFAASYLWTGTDDGGTDIGSTCAGWTQGGSGAAAGVGTALGTDPFWTFISYDSCDHLRRLLCLEPGASEATPPRWLSPGALVFVTSAASTGDLGSWPQAGGQTGLAAGDAICRNLAAAAHLPSPQSFVAWLSDGATDAVDRLTISAPFKRIDGLTVASSKADLVDGATSVSINQDEHGVYGVTISAFTWTGTDADGTGATTNCGGWTSSDPGGDGQVGSSALERFFGWTDEGGQGCGLQRTLYCFANAVTIFWDGFDYTGDASRWSSVVP
jgi:hypothetical protein